MLIKVLLIGGSLLLMFYFFVAARGRPIQKIAMICVFGLIIAGALFPKASDSVAAVFGVGRGADLALYLSTMALLFLCFTLYLNQKKIESQLILVVRELALQRAASENPPDHADEEPPSSTA